VKVWIPHEVGRTLVGELPRGVTLEVFTGADGMPSDPATVEFWSPPFLSSGDTTGLARTMPALRVVQLLSAGADAWVGRVPDTAVLCDGRGGWSRSTCR
jgi:hypothetical protein